MQTNDPFFGDSNTDKNVSAELIKSVQALFQSDRVAVGKTSDAAIPLPLSGRAGGKLKPSEQQALLIGCGASSKGLCAIVFDRQEAFEEFTAANPAAKKTLVTRGLSGQLVFWFRCADWVPPDTTTPSLTWCSDGLVPVAWADEKLEVRVVRNLPVAQAQFAHFYWDSQSDRAFWIARQIALHGPVVRQVGPRKRILNDNIVCRVFAKDADIVYDTAAQQFLRKSPSGESEQFAEGDLLDLFAAWLNRLAPEFGGSFPMSELRLPRLRSMLRHLKTVASIAEPPLRERLLSYLKRRICVRPGADLTAEEIRVDHDHYAQQHGTGRYPLCRFQRQVPKLIEEIFGVVRAHNIERWNDAEKKMTSRRGFNGLGFRADADGKGGADGPDAKLQNTPKQLQIDVASP